MFHHESHPTARDEDAISESRGIIALLNWFIGRHTFCGSDCQNVVRRVLATHSSNVLDINLSDCAVEDRTSCPEERIRQKITPVLLVSFQLGALVVWQKARSGTLSLASGEILWQRGFHRSAS